MTATIAAADQAFEAKLGAMRPRLHRYCARMTGSTIDGEDVVQDALMKAFAARASFGALDNAESWLLRIAHNAALDFLRQRARLPAMDDAGELEEIAAPDLPDPEIAVTSLRTFMRLPALQRSAVILKDVLGHSLDEAAQITGASPPALKSALQRGRQRLRALAGEPEDFGVAVVGEAARARLCAYVDGFRSGDFDAVRELLAEDVRLDLVARLQRRGKGEVGEYLGRYAAAVQWAYAAAVVDGRAGMLVYDRAVSLDTPAYFVVLAFDGGRVVSIRDFLFARYALEGAEIHLL
ncbi:sigma-70 family RNA polymerase sigma factor [Variovorax sp.]|uniref:sigma-70 family RNA polymerase sigma factor n=1 Tax=Variovorax sp. TaxID=1871043 RepID=UPI002D368084|nr:sigma-70 family RNA polymerase sigma factor [Variovorax sp.]HYP82737.1 sigma-70 family RNA polymerase sigma factor [Variovorax sp.]